MLSAMYTVAGSIGYFWSSILASALPVIQQQYQKSLKLQILKINYLSVSFILMVVIVLIRY